jgi:hypothetical protein
MSALFEVLSKIQKEMKAPKSQFNAFGKYKYRSCEDILEAVKPFLNGAVLYISDEMVLIGERYYIKATATLRNGDEAVSVTAYAREEAEKKGMDSSQITGAASSYARKYALNGLFLIDDTKDSDATNEHGKGEAANSKPKGNQVNTLKEKLVSKKEETPSVGKKLFADIFKFWMSKDEDDAANRATAYEAINRYASHVGIKKAIKDAADLDKLTEKECDKIAEAFNAERKAV